MQSAMNTNPSIRMQVLSSEPNGGFILDTSRRTVARTNPEQAADLSNVYYVDNVMNPAQSGKLAATSGTKVVVQTPSGPVVVDSSVASVASDNPKVFDVIAQTASALQQTAGFAQNVVDELKTISPFYDDDMDQGELYIGNAQSRKKKSVPRLVEEEINHTAGKLKRIIDGIPPAVYWLVVVALVVAMLVWLWRHSIYQISIGPYKGYKGRGTFSFLGTFGGNKELLFPPAVAFEIGGGHFNANPTKKANEANILAAEAERKADEARKAAQEASNVTSDINKRW